jgi:hypothetical protein
MKLSGYALFFCIILILGTFYNNSHAAIPYAIGTPVLTDIWVDPVNGNDSRNGSSRSLALRTVAGAWNRIPTGTMLTSSGYRILLVSGNYSEENLPPNGWLESRYGTYPYPIIIQAADGAHTAVLHGYLNIYDVRYLYLVNLDIVTDKGYGSGSNAVHIASSNHILIRGCRVDGFDGTARQPQETLKVNQTQYIYVENSEFSGAYWFPFDFVAVQYGHILNNKIHDSGDDCMVLKGGTAYFTVDSNEIYNCGNIGFTAGQGTGFEYMVSPWLHYEAYDIKFTNNIIYDAVNAGMAVRGGYNILLAYNTLYHTGYDPRGSALLLVAHGSRGCDAEDDADICKQNNQAGGWGTDSNAGVEDEVIPNRNVYVYNNIFYNPTQPSASHFDIHGSVTPPSGSNILSPSYADTNLQIRGNLIWNGAYTQPFGIEEKTQGCQAGNLTCSLNQLKTDNAVNIIEPQLVNPSGGNFRISNVFDDVLTYSVSDFTWTDAPSRPAVPMGILSNTVSYDRDQKARTSSDPPGAYIGAIICPFTTVSPEFLLHIPVISFNGTYVTADLQFRPGTTNDVMFDTIKAEFLSASDINSGCQPSLLQAFTNGKYFLSIPAMFYNNLSYWANLEYIPANDGAIRFKLTAAGQN